ncbi:hypothetical protein P8T57_20730 [Thalassospira sp. SN3W]|uniref:hypothetical protein n=1 Tax=Thalassospira sp. SN3W TaxID=3035476 RepID=UPI00311AF67B
MANSSYARSSLALAAMEFVPPILRKTLLNQREFCEEYGLKTDAVIGFGDLGVSLPRSDLFDAIRNILSDGSERIVSDTDGQDWKVFVEGKDGEPSQILISNNDRRFKLPDFNALSPDSTIRLQSLQKESSDVNLPLAAKTAWQNVLMERSLEDDEVDTFHSEFRDTPVNAARSIHAEFQQVEGSAQFLVPSSRRYLTRLVGEYDGSASIYEYAVGAGRNFMEGLSKWRSYDGFLSSLFLSSHSTLTAEISVKNLDRRDISRALEFLINSGDRLSQLGAVEVGLRVLPDIPEIETLLVRLIEQIRDDDPQGSTSGFKLFSALFVFVDGALSERRLLSDVPPFYRRLASLAHAALIQREAVATSIEIDYFCEWAWSSYGERFYYQSLVDMRLEPRWKPDFAEASQIKADFLGRLMIAGKSNEKNIRSNELRALLLGADSGSIHSVVNFPRPYYPGPLEGQDASPVALPDDLAETVEARLKEDEVGPASFIALVNSVLIFRVDQSQAKLAAEALKAGEHRLARVEDHSQLFAILQGLATVAAVSRVHSLADGLRILVRQYRHDTQYTLSIDEALTICLVASASRDNLNDWVEYVGDWLADLAFENFQGTEGESLYSHLRCLCHSVPELWISCGRADAALKAYLDI